jgi:hypothetical protein
MNRRQFFARTAGVVVAAAVGPDAIRQLPPLRPVLPRMVPYLGGHYDGKFAFVHAVNHLESALQRRVLRTLNADLIGDGRG